MNRILKSKDEIRQYLKMGWDKIMLLKRVESLPVAKMGRRWEADAVSLDEWQADRIKRVINQRAEKA
jgi:hypothetical protein